MNKTSLFFLLFIALFSANISFASSLESMPYGGVSVVHSLDCSKTDYPAVSDSDTERGNVLMSAVSDIQNGGDSSGLTDQSIYLTSGNFDIGENTIDLSKGLIPGMLSNNNLHGAGKLSTVIKSSIHGEDSLPIVTPAVDSQVTDLTRQSSSPSDYAFPFGIGLNGAHFGYDMGTVYLKNVKLMSPTDGIYFNTWVDITTVLNVINVTSESGWDNIAILGHRGLTLNIFDSNFSIPWTSVLTQTNFHGLQDQAYANINIYNSSFLTNGRGTIYGIYTNGLAKIYNSLFSSNSVAGVMNHYDFFAYNGGSIGLSPSVALDPLKVSGNVSTTTEVAEVVPTLPAERCSNPFSSTPTVQASSTVSSIATDSTTLNATLSSDGLLSISSIGFNYGTTTAYGSVSSSTGVFSVGDFSKSISGLSCGTTYNFQAFAVNLLGVGTSTNQTFTTLSCPPSVITIAPTTHRSSRGQYSHNYFSISQPVTEITATTTQVSVGDPIPVSISNNFGFGDQGENVKYLQKYLNSHGFAVAISGPGSLKNETTFFGRATKNALIKFQKSKNIIPATGYFGPKTRNSILNIEN